MANLCPPCHHNVCVTQVTHWISLSEHNNKKLVINIIDTRASNNNCFHYWYIGRLLWSVKHPNTENRPSQFPTAQSDHPKPANSHIWEPWTITCLARFTWKTSYSHFNFWHSNWSLGSYLKPTDTGFQYDQCLGVDDRISYSVMSIKEIWQCYFCKSTHRQSYLMIIAIFWLWQRKITSSHLITLTKLWLAPMSFPNKTGSMFRPTYLNCRKKKVWVASKFFRRM